MASVINIWAYESEDAALRAWRGLTALEREEADIIWRYSMQRKTDLIRSTQEDTTERLDKHEWRLASVERWRITVSSVLLALAVAGGGAPAAFAVIDRIAG